MKFGLIGLSIQKSSSPAMHEMLGELFNAPLTYQLNEPSGGEAEDFGNTLNQIREQGFLGTNVTFPFKKAAVAFCDEVDEAVQLVGSTNTLKISESSVSAFNTDYSGFISGYKHRLGEMQAGKVLLIGAGGVGRAVAFGLFKVGATEVAIYDLDQDSAGSLVDAINEAGLKASLVSKEQLASIAGECDGLVNCTPIGHYKTPGCPLPAELIGPQKWAFDAVYTPIDTEFLKQCAAHDMKIVSGFDLFFYQALNAFEIFTGITPDPQQVIAEYKQRFSIESSLI